MPTIQDQLIRAIKSSGQTRYQIAHGAGVAQSQITRLFSGESRLTTTNIELIAEYLGLELVLRTRSTRREK